MFVNTPEINTCRYNLKTYRTICMIYLNLHISNMSGMCSMNALHCCLHFFEERRGIMHSCASKHDSDSRIRLVDLMNTQGFLVRGAPYDEHNYVLWSSPIGPVVTSHSWIKIFSKFPLDQIFERVFQERRVLCVDVFHAVQALDNQNNSMLG